MMRITKKVTRKNVQQQPTKSSDTHFEITGVEIELDGIQYDCSCDVVWYYSGGEEIENFDVFYNGDHVDVFLNDSQKKHIVDSAMVFFDSDREISESMYNEEMIGYDYDR